MKHPNNRSQDGFTMLEVLVTILILSIGLLGFAGLQLASLRNTHESEQRSTATQLAREIADRVRANFDAAVDGDYDIVTPAVSSTCFSTGCTDTQLASTDLAAWQAVVATRLPNGNAQLCRDSTIEMAGTPIACDNAPDAPYTVYIEWTERGQNAGTQRFATQFERY